MRGQCAPRRGAQQGSVVIVTVVSDGESSQVGGRSRVPALGRECDRPQQHVARIMRGEHHRGIVKISIHAFTECDFVHPWRSHPRPTFVN
jgi:hypothetical protein